MRFFLVQYMLNCSLGKNPPVLSPLREESADKAVGEKDAARNHGPPYEGREEKARSDGRRITENNLANRFQTPDTDKFQLIS